ncbi:hypothetical protein ABZ023_18590 [Streptomyces sp. NPDC006367]|uniref:hypothetical protein n=1 Tax=unclassified Streptomyces TaxID=2593676 RepID=UPI0033BBD081
MTFTHDRALPDGFTVHLRTALNMTVLTLHDGDGWECQIGFHASTELGSPELTVRALNEITDDALRAAALELLNNYFARRTTVHANADAFSAAVPDWSDLTGRLRRTVPDCRIDTGLDHQALALTMTLAADGPSAGRLLTLIASWPEGAAEGIDRELTQTGTLTVRFSQKRAQDFLTWYRTEPGFNVDFDADSVYLRDGKDEIAMWTEAEWTEDPRLVLGIVNAVHIGHTQGSAILRDALAAHPKAAWPPLP